MVRSVFEGNTYIAHLKTVNLFIFSSEKKKTAQTRVECRSLDLSHFLLEPVQRITRYPLLLRQVLNIKYFYAEHNLNYVINRF